MAASHCVLRSASARNSSALLGASSADQWRRIKPLRGSHRHSLLIWWNIDAFASRSPARRQSRASWQVMGGARGATYSGNYPLSLSASLPFSLTPLSLCLCVYPFLSLYLTVLLSLPLCCFSLLSLSLSPFLSASTSALLPLPVPALFSLPLPSEGYIRAAVVAAAGPPPPAPPLAPLSRGTCVYIWSSSLYC